MPTRDCEAGYGPVKDQINQLSHFFYLNEREREREREGGRKGGRRENKTKTSKQNILMVNKKCSIFQNFQIDTNL